MLIVAPDCVTDDAESACLAYDDVQVPMFGSSLSVSCF